MQAKKLNQTVQLVNGSFTPSEVSSLILDSIDNQINNCKLKNLSNWIHDHNCDQEIYDNEIAQLTKRKEELQGMIKEATLAGCNIRLTENLELTLDN